MRKIMVFLSILIVTCCKNQTDYYENEDTIQTDQYGNELYPDGTYCAEVEYYNPDTGTRNTYTLNVEVENNEVTEIHWPNGGWLDDSHFSPEELDSDGSCSFTSDKGYEYTIQITGSECSYTDEVQIESDLEQEQEELICSKCGGEKDDSYDELCWYCEKKEKRKREDIEEHTCKRCGQYDSSMSSSSELCSECEREEVYEIKNED